MRAHGVMWMKMAGADWRHQVGVGVAAISAIPLLVVTYGAVAGDAPWMAAPNDVLWTTAFLTAVVVGGWILLQNTLAVLDRFVNAVQGVSKQAGSAAESSLRVGNAQLDAILLALREALPEERIAAIRRAEAAQRAADPLQAQRLAAESQRVREEERTRIAREIHDELGQLMTCLAMDLALARERLGTDPAAAASAVITAEKRLEEVLGATRRICADLRPAAMNGLTLTEALELQVAELRRYTGVRCDMTLDLGTVPLAGNVSAAVYRILQEASTNVMRHAQATAVKIVVQTKGEWIAIEIADNGRGFPGSRDGERRTFGLAGIQERACALGGTMDVSTSAQGTTVRVRLPLSPVKATDTMASPASPRA